MSLEIVKDQIDKFVASKVPGVLVIKGPWGAGKTFAWNKYLLEARDKKRIGLEQYSYNSMFGVNSIERFRYSIFENVVDRDLIGTEASVDTFRKNAGQVLSSLTRKGVRLVKGASLLKDFTPAVESLSFLFLEKKLVCIDDLERKGADLSIKDILGVVSWLKEQKKCQVVIILNDGELESENDEYIKYREKVVDIELAFDPTPMECASIAFSESNPNYVRLRELTTNLGIRNIRILKKIEHLVNLAIPLTEGFVPEIANQVMHSIVLFTWCYCSPESDEKVPDLEFITSKENVLIGLGDEKLPEKERAWSTILQSYGYHFGGELDLILAAAVKAGYLHEKEFKKEAALLNDELNASISSASFSEAWKLYHDTFNDNRDEVIDTLYDSFKENCNYITPGNLSGTVTLFRKLGEEKKASELIDIYIERRKYETELFNMEENNLFGHVTDQEVIERFNELYRASVTTESAKEVLERIAGKDGWNTKDEVVLANTSIDDYYGIFKSESGRKLQSFIATCLGFGQFGNATDQQKEIAKRTTQALKNIAAESEINKLRVKKFGVAVDDL